MSSTPLVTCYGGIIGKHRQVFERFTHQSSRWDLNFKFTVRNLNTNIYVEGEMNLFYFNCYKIYLILNFF